MPYTADAPDRKVTNELRARIPGWGVDLDPRDRPAVPRERRDLETGAHWHLPELQAQPWPRERSVEHGMLPPVFGTSCPPKALSGRLRQLSYARFSEARAAHWLLLLAADRVDVLESSALSLVSRRPDVPFVETGLRSEVSHHGLRSRFGRGRTDIRHQWVDPVVVAGPWVALGAVAYRGVRALVRRAS